MVRAELIHDVLWITRTHESCPKDAAPNVGGKRTAAAAAGSSSSAQQQDELMEKFLAVYPVLAPMSDSSTYSILMVISLSVLHLNGLPGYVFGEHFIF